MVYDGWTATDSAVKALMYAHADPSKHKVEFRNAETGLHTNDVEFEKMWNEDTIGQRQFDFTTSSNLTLMDH